MKNSWVLFLLLSVCSAQSDTKPESLIFRGVYIGQSLSDFMSCPGKKAKDPAYKVHGKICEDGAGYLSSMKVHRSWSALSGATSDDVVYNSAGAYDGMEFSFLNGVVNRIIIRTPRREDWNNLLSDLVKKLGEPGSSSPQVFQNGFGARWEFPLVGWSKDGVSVTAGVDARRDSTDKVRIEVVGTKLIVEKTQSSGHKSFLETSAAQD